MSEDPKITAVAPWYGGCRMLADTIGQQIGDVGWCGIPFCGGLPEVLHIRTRAGVANDLHRHIINLARVIQHEPTAKLMGKLVEGLLFHPEEYAAAQKRCLERELAWELPAGGLFGERVVPKLDDAQWAADYFVCCWMGRGGSAGQEWEFKQSISTRWTPTGGGSARRWRSAVESLRAWTKLLADWEFTCLDAFAFLDMTPDRPDMALYVDAPWRGAGEQYAHKFSDDDQRRLARKLTTYENVRVVVRFGEDPLIRKLYPEPRWTWIEQESRNQEGNVINEVLIVNGPAYEEVT